MPGARCAVAICTNSYENSKKNDLAISFHNFPREEKIKNIWIKSCYRKDMWNPKTSTICSVHFAADDFESDLRAKLMGIKTKPKLKQIAVPSQFLKKRESDIDSEIGKASRHLRAEKRLNKKVVEDLLNAQPSVSSAVGDEMGIMEKTLQEQFEELAKEHEDLKNKYAEIQGINRKNKLVIEKLRKDAAQITRKLEDANVSIKMSQEVLNKTFSKAQVQLLSAEKKKVFWSSEDIAHAFTLRYLGKRSYIYLRNKLKYPLPHLSTLQKWAAKLKFRQGILKDVLNLIKIAGLTLTDFEKVAVVDFDEVKVESTFEYDKANDEILGPHKQMQVVMIRGLFSQWKQPIYIDFDQKVTSDILNEILQELHHIGFNVVSCVADCGGGNVGLWKSLDLSIEKTYFLHPVSEEKVYFFPDVPHLLKLVRNWLLDTGFILSDGSTVNKRPLRDLMEITDAELSVCYRLTNKHLECEKTERQNVGLAAQLLSHTVATALLHYQPGNDKKLARDTGTFIEIVSKWFDLMNTYTPTEKLCTKKPYGMDLQRQNKCLDEMYQMVHSMKCTGKNTLQIFQKGILMSITSIKLLLQDMKEKYNCSYILTHRVNQDCLESFFSQLRTRGGLHDHPSPLSAMYRIRMIVLGKNPGSLQKKTNIQIAENSHAEYLVAHVFKGAGVDVTPNRQDTEEPLSDCSLSSASSVHSGKPSTVGSEDDGFLWLCGWLARKFREKHPTMGKYTKDLYTNPSHDACDMPLTWIQHLSFGGLTEPSEEWVLQAKEMESIFTKFNKNGFPIRKNMLKKLTSIAKKKCAEVPEEVINAYMLQRIYIRIKKLNKERVTMEIGKKRKSDFDGGKETRKLKNKMKKLVK